MEDFRKDRQMTLAEMYVCTDMIRVCVRVSFVGECKNEKKVLTEQKKNRTSIDKRVSTIVTLHCFSCLTLNTVL